jgi:acyl-CoA synthetase (AMP-forming)/AMP-acid ligase II
MRDLANALTIQGTATVISTGEQTHTGTSVLEQSAAFDRAITRPDGSRILSLDPSPATILALLVLAESRTCQLILGRPSIDLAALGKMLQPDVIVHRTGRIERRGDSSSGESGIFLLTSGTTGTPKVVHQTLPALLGRVQTSSLEKNRGARWLLTYETHSFAGLQVVLSAALSGGVLVAPEARNPAALAHAARNQGVTHISGTPTFSRALLMTIKDEGLPSLRQITLGGEAVDQATLNRVSQAFPHARVSHIYASTEAGALFAVHDGRAGFPSAWLGHALPGGVMLRIRDEVLEVRSPRCMLAYASGQRAPLTEDGWLVTGDLVRVEGNRVLFSGRQDQIVNIAGLKVSPEEVEAFLLAQPTVDEAQVYAVPSPLTGSLLAARIVVHPGLDPQETLQELQTVCARGLSRHKVPRRFEIVDRIAMSTSGKKAYTS